MPQPTFYEFFAGGGMARAGLGPHWRCLFANDFDPEKGQAYQDNWGSDDFRLADVAGLETSDLPGRADLAWASFPCQDLSLAGAGGGLSAPRSGAFWSFWALMRALDERGRAPRVIVLENVLGLLSARAGRDFNALCRALAAQDYDVGALAIDAARFTAQSRPRLFIIAAREPRRALFGNDPETAFSPSRLLCAAAALDPVVKARWRWWRLPTPATRPPALADIVMAGPNAAPWDAPQETDKLLALMAPRHRARVETARAFSTERIGALFRRTRTENGRRVSRAEVRFDDRAGCLRTPGGGSSRQRLVFAGGGRVRTRLIAPREAARLMGLEDSYHLPLKLGPALHLIGDGVAPPVVRHLAAHVLEPLLDCDATRRAA